MTAWVLRDPFGNFVPGTLDEDKSQAQSAAFGYLYVRREDPEFAWTARYWKRLEPFVKARKRRGWHVVAVKLLEIGDAKA